MSVRWDNYFLRHALESAKMSKDPRTKVGACLVIGRHIISTGYNGFPEGMKDTPSRYADRDFKLEHVVHAEENAICIAARLGIRTDGATIYIAATDDSEEIWGGPLAFGVRCRVCKRVFANTFRGPRSPACSPIGLTRFGRQSL